MTAHFPVYFSNCYKIYSILPIVSNFAGRGEYSSSLGYCSLIVIILVQFCCCCRYGFSLRHSVGFEGVELTV